ncbi:MAG: glycosyltransferase family 39 protein [Acidobacteria bacterium]|nr:glycosyltransferase family 39 protein [Acidobacteriota bacterium]
MRRDLLLLLVIAAAALGIRTYPAWNNVFTAAGINFLETDAWYHVRLIENQVRNYPWRVTLDPFAAPGGQFVPIAPLFDTITSTAVVVLHGRDADTGEVERVAAFVPPVLGTLAVIVVWALARQLFDRRAGLLAASLLAILPGHFLDRTMLGFVDHHALEALMAMATLLAFSRGVTTPSPSMSLLAGVGLGLYLLGWGSGAFLIAVIGVWLLLLAALSRSSESLCNAAQLTGVAALVALLLVGAFQDSRMHRYESQVLGLVGLAGLSVAIRLVAGRRISVPSKGVVLGASGVLAVMATVIVSLVTPELATQLAIDLGRLAPDPRRMGVLEARPLFLYSGEWRWAQPWSFFRTGFFIGCAALLPFSLRVWKQRRPADVLLLVFAVVTLVATIGQNRFGYYLVPACAVLGGWLAMQLLDWGGVPHAENPTPRAHTRLPLAREVAIVAVAGAMFAPNMSLTLLLAERSASFPSYWRDTMDWLRRQTPEPFAPSAGAGDDYYFARYPRDMAPRPDYSIMSWWDQGYWLTQRARRVPVANPTQQRAPNAARFYSATTESEAVELLREERTRFVISDWELPFRRLQDGTIMGRFQNILDWAGADHTGYYEIVYRRNQDGWAPQWVFHERYYRSMAYRLSVLGGAASVPVNASAVVTLVDRIDANGRRFREVLTQVTYGSYALAQQAAAASTVAQTFIVGLDPWLPAFPLDAVTSFVEVHGARTADQKPSEAPWVRVFEVRSDAAGGLRPF